MHKFAWLLVAIAIAAYAIRGLVVDDLVMPYRWRDPNHWHDPVTHWRDLHLRGMWAIGGFVCLLLGAAGFAILSYGKPGTKPGKEPYRNLATVLIAVGGLFFLGVTTFTQWFVR